MAGALVSAILNQLATVTQQEWRLLSGVEQEVNKVERNLKAIHSLLEDAEERQMIESSVKLWLARVKEASYDLEDVLDEWKTIFLKSKAVEAGQTLKKKVLSLIFCDLFRQVGWRHIIAVRIERINGVLDEIANEKDRYQLLKREIKQPRRAESTSFVDVSKLHGRDEVKKEIVGALLSEESRQTISLVGMGGIGKTALAQLIYNDDQIRNHFSKVIWVCVSNYFDQYNIARVILSTLVDYNSPIPTSLDGILKKVCEEIANTKFFLVLDDVWTERDEDWEPFQAVFFKGMSGSRVLVTTRKDSVATAMESFRVFHLEQLSDQFSWMILSQIAFSGKDKVVCGTLEDVGKEIAKKCKGLPLAAKTLGGLLREKSSKDEWLKVLNSELWRSSLAQEYIFTPLMLSYYDLPPAIRQCFSYCVIFPKDHLMEKFMLITHWMALGYLSSDDGENVDMEVVGEEYFNCLASRSLFQDFSRDRSGSIESCKMHDIVYDFVKFLVKDEFSAYSTECELELRVGNARHSSLYGEPYGTPVDNREFRILCSRKKLRSFVVVSPQVTWFVEEPSHVRIDCLKVCASPEYDEAWRSPLGVLENISEKEKCLRILKTPGLRGNPKKLGKLGGLIHLRYLDVSCSYLIKRLPEEVCELHNLQLLNVSYCPALITLPDGIGKLINLRYLLSYASLTYHPKGIAKLTRLRRLDYVVAEASNHPTRFSIGDLEKLDFLRETLFVDVAGTSLDMEDLRRAALRNKTHLEQLYIRLGEFRREDGIQDRVLQALNPLPNLTIEFTNFLN